MHEEEDVFMVSFAFKECGGQLNAEQNKNTLTSPFHPQQYTNGMSCEWEITSQPGTSITLDFQFLAVRKPKVSCIRKSEDF